MYEFESSSAPEDGEVRSTCIIVPFQAVFALRCEDDHVTLQMESGPVMFLGRRNTVLTVQDRASDAPLAASLAMHLEHFPVHKVRLKADDVSQVKRRLWQYSPRFHDLMLRPMCSADTKLQQPLPPYGALGKAAIRQPRHPLSETWHCTMGEGEAGGGGESTAVPPVTGPIALPPRNETDASPTRRPTASTAIPGCSCRLSCRATRCSCAKARARCEPGRCACTSCDNPLNFLVSVGVPEEQARGDPCLMQAVFQAVDLAWYLCQRVRLNCCSESVTVRECIPGRVTCPRCALPAQYSWCANTLFHGPTNHCAVCMRCNLFAGAHCQKCNSCYYFGLGSAGCPRCQPTEQVRAEGADQAQTRAILAQCGLPAQERTPTWPRHSTPRRLLPKPVLTPQ
ncbi:unnamed protein product, partial [Ixodes hexagonus]